MEKKGKVLCPSARCEPGAVLLGVVRQDGRIAYLPPGFVVDEQFSRIAHEGRNPESRFRFSARCVESSCRQWAGGRCTVPDQVRSRLAAPPAPGEPPTCAIRPQCRWHRQDGPAACALCPLVITDLLPLDEEAGEAPAISLVAAVAG
jgi:hypothetical protein